MCSGLFPLTGWRWMNFAAFNVQLLKCKIPQAREGSAEAMASRTLGDTLDRHSFPGTFSVLTAAPTPAAV